MNEITLSPKEAASSVRSLEGKENIDLAGGAKKAFREGSARGDVVRVCKQQHALLQ